MSEAKSKDKPKGSAAGLIPIEQASKLLMIGAERIRQHIKDGFIPRATRGKVSLVGAVQGRLRFLEEQLQKSTQASGANKVRDAREREINLRIAKEENRLIEFDEAQGVLDELIGDFKAALAGLPARVTKDPVLRVTIERNCDDILRKLAADTAEKAKAVAAGGSSAPTLDEVDA